MNYELRIINYAYSLLTIAFLLVFATSCDDGHVDEKTYVYNTDSYNVQLSGNFTKTNTWGGKYTLALCGFNETDKYATIAKSLSNIDGEATIKLSNIPPETKTVEIAVINILRERMATLYKYDISDTDNINDTIKINVGEMNLGMFAHINNNLFQGTKTSCSKCHSGNNPRAGLDLSTDKAYSSIVGVASTKSPDNLLVKAGDAENSFLYKVISVGDENIHYSHTQLTTDEQTMLDILKQWIEAGAKE